MAVPQRPAASSTADDAHLLSTVQVRKHSSEEERASPTRAPGPSGGWVVVRPVPKLTRNQPRWGTCAYSMGS